MKNNIPYTYMFADLAMIGFCTHSILLQLRIDMVCKYDLSVCDRIRQYTIAVIISLDRDFTNLHPLTPPLHALYLLSAYALPRTQYFGCDLHCMSESELCNFNLNSLLPDFTKLRSFPRKAKIGTNLLNLKRSFLNLSNIFFSTYFTCIRNYEAGKPAFKVPDEAVNNFSTHIPISEL